jgi:hypothetical protein
MDRREYLLKKLSNLHSDIANEASPEIVEYLKGEQKKTEAELDELLKRNCTNCAYCERFDGYDKNYKKAPCMRCWEEPGVCDHPISMTMEEAKLYTCENHKTPGEYADEKYNDAACDVMEWIKSIKKTFDKYPTLKDKFKDEIQELRG